MTWKPNNIDPTAGVPLVTRQRYCARCGISKGAWSATRPGLCHDCAGILKADERAAWAA